LTQGGWAFDEIAKVLGWGKTKIWLAENGVWQTSGPGLQALARFTAEGLDLVAAGQVESIGRTRNNRLCYDGESKRCSDHVLTHLGRDTDIAWDLAVRAEQPSPLISRFYDGDTNVAENALREGRFQSDIVAGRPSVIGGTGVNPRYCVPSSAEGVVMVGDRSGRTGLSPAGAATCEIGPDEVVPAPVRSACRPRVRRTVPSQRCLRLRAGIEASTLFSRTTTQACFRAGDLTFSVSWSCRPEAEVSTELLWRDDHVLFLRAPHLYRINLRALD